jgi:hypothetical protein
MDHATGQTLRGLFYRTKNPRLNTNTRSPVAERLRPTQKIFVCRPQIQFKLQLSKKLHFKTLVKIARFAKKTRFLPKNRAFSIEQHRQKNLIGDSHTERLVVWSHSEVDEGQRPCVKRPVFQSSERGGSLPALVRA